MTNWCIDCGREIKSDESSYVLLDPKGEWWLHLYDGAICRECIIKRRQSGGDEMVSV